MSVIEVSGLTKSYGARRGVIELDFAVEAGEVFGFLGPNGAGKTTTIRLLTGMVCPTVGEVRVFGHDAWRDAPAVHRQMAVVASDPGFLGELTVAGQLDHLAGLRNLPAGVWRPLAERLELEPNVQIRRLSRGNRQKIGVVAVFMGAESLLVMDEPTSGLDPLMQREFLGLVSEARAAGRTVFLSSHNLAEVERSCDRVGVIREGRLVEIAPMQALIGLHWRSVNIVFAETPDADAFDLPDVRVVATSGREAHLMVRGDVNPLVRRLGRYDLVDLSVATPDLEDVFLHLYEPTAPGAVGTRTADVTR
jgi:ABC-2 type transport system ATP-binding protein